MLPKPGKTSLETCQRFMGYRPVGREQHDGRVAEVASPAERTRGDDLNPFEEKERRRDAEQRPTDGDHVSIVRKGA